MNGMAQHVPGSSNLPSWWGGEATLCLWLISPFSLISFPFPSWLQKVLLCLGGSLGCVSPRRVAVLKEKGIFHSQGGQKPCLV